MHSQLSCKSTKVEGWTENYKRLQPQRGVRWGPWGCNASTPPLESRMPRIKRSTWPNSSLPQQKMQKTSPVWVAFLRPQRMYNATAATQFTSPQQNIWAYIWSLIKYIISATILAQGVKDVLVGSCWYSEDFWIISERNGKTEGPPFFFFFFLAHLIQCKLSNYQKTTNSWVVPWTNLTLWSISILQRKWVSWTERHLSFLKHLTGELTSC